MSNHLKIIMYHYIKDGSEDLLPGLKYLNISEFVRHLDFLSATHTFVSSDEVKAFFRDGNSLPDNPVLLTFDDGYHDHYEHVFPLLKERGIRGVFFPATSPLREKKILFVNKLQLLLGRLDTAALYYMLSSFISHYAPKPLQAYKVLYEVPGRWDSPQRVFIKQVLQKGLAEDLRFKFVDKVFNDEFDKDGNGILDALYMNLDQLSEMRDAGMEIGCHGDQHHWLDILAPEALAQDLDDALEFLNAKHLISKDWSICYPYGGYNDYIVEQCRKRGAMLGYVTDPRVVDLEKADQMLLPRLDAHDLSSEIDSLAGK